MVSAGPADFAATYSSNANVLGKFCFLASLLLLGSWPSELRGKHEETMEEVPL
jgi:hypothetical protein